MEKELESSLLQFLKTGSNERADFSWAGHTGNLKTGLSNSLSNKNVMTNQIKTDKNLPTYNLETSDEKSLPLCIFH